MLNTAAFLKIVATARPNFLILTPCCLSLPVAYVFAEKIPINYLHLILIFIGALAAHASVNMFNEYGDFTSGLDLHTQRTPFSGGSGALPAAPQLARPAWMAAVFCLLLTAAIGFYFVWVCGWWVLPVGLLGIVLVCFYTSKITRGIIVFAVCYFRGKTAVQYANHMEKLRPALAINVVITLMIPLLMAAGIILQIPAQAFRLL